MGCVWLVLVLFVVFYLVCVCGFQISDFGFVVCLDFGVFGYCCSVILGWCFLGFVVSVFRFLVGCFGFASRPLNLSFEFSWGWSITRFLLFVGILVFGFCG